VTILPQTQEVKEQLVKQSQTRVVELGPEVKDIDAYEVVEQVAMGEVVQCPSCHKNICTSCKKFTTSCSCAPQQPHLWNKGCFPPPTATTSTTSTSPSTLPSSASTHNAGLSSMKPLKSDWVVLDEPSGPKQYNQVHSNCFVTFKNCSYIVSYDKNTNAGLFKKLLCQKFEVNPDEYKLMYIGSTVDDNKLLLEYPLGDDTTLRLVKRVNSQQ